MWSNGNILHGEWKHTDGTSFTGRFQGTEPQGDGLYTFSNGKTQAGVYDNQNKWNKDQFNKPSTKVRMSVIIYYYLFININIIDYYFLLLVFITYRSPHPLCTP